MTRIRKTALNISDAIDAKLLALVEKTKLSKTALLEQAIDLLHAQVMAEPSLILGYIQIGRTGDLEPAETDCTDCGQSCEVGGLWLRIGSTHGQISMSGTLCQRCASSE